MKEFGAFVVLCAVTFLACIGSFALALEFYDAPNANVTSNSQYNR